MLKVKPSSWKWALDHALKYGDTDVFPAAFEYQALKHDWTRVLAEIADDDVLQWKTRPARTLLAPKAKYGFRVVTQLDPLDHLLYSALVYEISAELESRRIPVNKSTVFSYRVATADEGQLFDPNVGYRQFLEVSRSKLRTLKGPGVIATTDISDFYSRIYHHRLENRLSTATKKSNHVKAIMHLLSGWNKTESYGIPVGNAPSRLLAEVALSDVDEALLARSIDFVRYNDDYRIFAASKSAAYKDLAFLAETLYKNHGLSLQPNKTDILSPVDFQNRHLATPLDKEEDSLFDRFEQLVDELGLDSRYEDIEYDDLSPSQQQLIDAMNLTEMFRDQVEKNDPDMAIVKFCLRRLGQLGDSSIVEYIFDGLDTLIPAFVDIMDYLTKLRFLDDQSKNTLGSRLWDLLDDSNWPLLNFRWVGRLRQPGSGCPGRAPARRSEPLTPRTRRTRLDGAE